MSHVKHSTDWILPFAFMCAGLFAAWFDGKWSCVTWVGLGYLGVLGFTLTWIRKPCR